MYSYGFVTYGFVHLPATSSRGTVLNASRVRGNPGRARRVEYLGKTVKLTDVADE